MEFVHLTPEATKQALPLAMRQYEQACEAYPELIHDGVEPALAAQLDELFADGYGLAAMQGGQMVGYLAYWQKIEGFFGKCLGAFSPLHGSAFIGPKRDQVFSRLFAQVSSELLQTGHTSFAQAVFASDEEIARAMNLCGFGIRCSDAIRLTATPIAQEAIPGVTVRKVGRDELPKLLPMAVALTAHLTAGPCYFPCGAPQAERSLTNPKRRTFAAFQNDQPVAYIQLTDSGENYLTEFPDVTNICGCYALPELRGSGMASLLLDEVRANAQREGKKLLGVDCETLNPTALRFWGKHFTPYTYSYHRRIDERLLG